MKYVTFIAISQTILVASGGGLIYYYFWDNLGYLFTSNEDIVGRTSSLMIFATIFLFALSGKSIFQGILRAAGYQLEIFGYVFFLFTFPVLI